MSLAKRIVELRTTKGMTQLQLADELSVTDKAVSKWERDLGEPNMQSLIALADIFSVSIDYLLTGKDYEKIVFMSKIERIAYEDDVEAAKKYPYSINDGMDYEGRSLVEYIYAYKSLKVFDYFVNSSQGRYLIEEPYRINDFLILCFETNNLNVISINNNKALINFTHLNTAEQNNRNREYIVDLNTFNYIINSEKLLDLVLRDNDIYWSKGVSKIIEIMSETRNPNLEKVINYIDKKNNEAQIFYDKNRDDYGRHTYNLFKDGVSINGKLIKTTTTITRKTINNLLEFNDYDNALKLNIYCDSPLSDHEFKMDRINKDNSIDNYNKIKESVIIDKIVDIQKLIEKDNYKLYKETIKLPTSKIEYAQQLLNKNLIKELYEYSIENKLSNTETNILKNSIDKLEDSINRDFKNKIQDKINSKYLIEKKYPYNKVMGKDAIFFEDIIKHKDLNFFKHAIKIDVEKIDWALEEILKERSKDYEVIKLLLDAGAKIHSIRIEDDGWGYDEVIDEIDDVATQLLKNQIDIFLKERKND